MKIIFYSSPFLADCDFPLVKALQDKGIDVRYYMPLPRNFQRASILEFENPIKKKGLVKASELKEMQKYKNCVDLNRFFIIKGFVQRAYWLPSWFLWIKVLLSMKKVHADVVHINWQFTSLFERFIFQFTIGKKKIMTVHDPIVHSGIHNLKKEEKRRKQSFKWANRFILLNTVQAQDFVKKYSISKDRVYFSNLCNYDSIQKIVPSSIGISGDFILFFGTIAPYKGLEYLLDAMTIVHQYCPNLKLVVAGGGDFYFEKNKYINLDYIIWIHRYVGINELAGLLKGTMFVVCPYKDATQSGVVQTAFAMNVPVLSTNVGNMSSVIEKGVNGFLVPPCSKSELADAIMTLYKGQDELQIMRHNIFKANQNNHLNNKVAEDYIKVYTE